MTLNSTAVPDAMISGPPIRPSIAIRRGTRPDRYIRQPRIRPFPTPTTQPGPSRNVQSWTATSDLPTVTSEAPLACASDVLPQRHDGKEAFEDREQHDGAANVGDDEQDLEQRAQGHARVGASADDVAGVIQHRGCSGGAPLESK